MQTEQHIAKGDEHIKWQRDVVDMLERISTVAEATEGARALLATFLAVQAQRQQVRDRFRADLYGNTDSRSTIPLAPFEVTQAQREQEHKYGGIFVGFNATTEFRSTVLISP